MRGEGNHKIPGSFAPENMEKTGAERVKYSLACQHEDAIPIKFVSYAQKCPTVLCTFAVALRKESVDRNIAPTNIISLVVLRSLSARRAWIEMDWASVITAMTSVALRKESVDRNMLPLAKISQKTGSLSARRAWIEICPTCQWRRSIKVALRKESVDRNKDPVLMKADTGESLSARRAWIEIMGRNEKPFRD